MALRNRRPSNCHPEKLAVNKAGQCPGCYQRTRRTGQATIATLQNAKAEIDAKADAVLADIDRSKQTLEELVAEADRTLLEAIPDAARYLRNAAAKASTRGDSRPAETILREVQVPTADGKGKRRLLEPPARQYDYNREGGNGPQIIVGVSIQNAVAPAIAAEGVKPLPVPSLSESGAMTVEAVTLPAITSGPGPGNRSRRPSPPCSTGSPP
jgi:hypothetical protein